jgi:Fe-S cluster assembly protein SufD
VNAAALPLPTRKDEGYRYADLAALETVWPAAVQVVRVPAGESAALSLIADGNGPEAHEIAITLEDGAVFDLRLLNAGAPMAASA